MAQPCLQGGADSMARRRRLLCSAGILLPDLCTSGDVTEVCIALQLLPNKIPKVLLGTSR
jgi:hypothetical protein